MAPPGEPTFPFQGFLGSVLVHVPVQCRPVSPRCVVPLVCAGWCMCLCIDPRLVLGVGWAEVRLVVLLPPRVHLLPTQAVVDCTWRRGSASPGPV